jgi:hypothetical protein
MSNLIEISEKIRDHLTQQRKQSMRTIPFDSISKETCAYLGDNGLMCAVGCLIKPEHYSKSLEGECAEQGDVVFAVEQSLGIKLDERLIDLTSEWQQYHDDEFNGLAYHKWVDGDEAHHPSKFHDSLNA